MKKTILASAILLAGAANAAEVYNNEGTSISLGGSFRGNVTIDSSDSVKFADAGTRFDIKAAKELDNGLKAFGSAEIKRRGDDTLYFNHSFVGLESDSFGTFTLGKQLGLNDDLVSNDFSYENGIYNHQDNTLHGSSSEDQLKYVKALGAASIVVSLIDQDTYAFGGTYEVAGLSLGATYTIANDRKTDADNQNLGTSFGAFSALSDNTSYILGAQYSLDALTVGVQYQATEVADKDTSAYGIGAHYALGKASVYAMYDIVDGTIAESSTTGKYEYSDYKGSELVVGADYEIAKDVKTYVEFNSSDEDSGSADETLWVGARVYF